MPEEAKLVTELSDDIKPLIKQYAEYGSRRNEIAHGTVHVYEMLVSGFLEAK
jgi:hypothetical protein